MNFRRVLTALAMVVVFTAIASAQSVSVPTMTCAVTGTNQTIRSQGVTESPGDVIITCGQVTGITANAATNPVERVNIVVEYSSTLTSRTGTNFTEPAGGVTYTPSEIMLLVNDPSGAQGNGPISGFGQNFGLSVCTAQQAVQDMNAIIAGGVPAGSGDLSLAANCPAVYKQVSGIWVLETAAGSGVQAKNAYQGVQSGAKVTFYNVPIINSGSSNVTNTYRVVNARVNSSSASTVTAKVTAAAPTTAGGLVIAGERFSIAAPEQPTVGTTASGLTTAALQANGISLCAPANIALSAPGNPNVALLKFTEGFNTAFKTRVLPLLPAVANDAQGGGAGQILPNGIYNYAGSPAAAPLLNIGSSTTPTLTLTKAMSESGVVFPNTGGVTAPGLASSGTRLKAVFANLPANVTYYVSASPVIDFRNQAAAPAIVGGSTDKSWAVALKQAAVGAASEAQAFVPEVTVGGPGGIPLVAVTRNTDGSAEVVWEVTNAVAGTDELTFAMFAQFNPNVGAITTGNNATVQLGFAPTTASTGTAASWIPRFVAPAAGTPFMQVLPCQTTLLFPYVTNVAGWNTGIAISNTGKDPFNTTGSTGTCNISFYGENQPASAVSFPNKDAATDIAPGSTKAATLSGLGLLNFQGYGVAVCNFQFAHGFAFVNDDKANMAMGYLSLVMQDTSRGISLLGEAFGQ